MKQGYSKNKFFNLVLSFLFVIASVFLFTACDGGGADDNNGSGNYLDRISYIDVDVNSAHYDSTSQKLIYNYKEEVNLNEIEFTVTAIKYSGESVALNQDDFDVAYYQEYPLNNEGYLDSGYYAVKVALKGEDDINTSVNLEVKPLTIYIPDFTEEQLSVTYNGEEHNIITEKIDALMPTSIETLSSALAGGHLTLQSSDTFGDNYAYAATNVKRSESNDNIDSYVFGLLTTRNYLISDEEGAEGSSGNKIIRWQITPKILSLPTYSQTEVPFDWEVVDENLQMKTLSTSLVYGESDDDVKENMVTITSGSLSTNSYSGTHNVQLTLTDTYKNNYAFEDKTYGNSFSKSAWVGEWSIAPYVFTSNPYQITNNPLSTYTYYGDLETDEDDITMPNFAYNPNGIGIELNLTEKEAQLFSWSDGGAYTNHFANNVNYSGDYYSVYISLNYTLTSVNMPFYIQDGQDLVQLESSSYLYYHVSSIDAPTEIINAVNSYIFEINPSTYSSLYPVTLRETYSLSDFTTATQSQFAEGVWRDYDVAGNDSSLVKPVNSNQNVSDANEAGYTVQLNYYYGQYNYNPISVSAKFVVNRDSLNVYSINASFSDNDSGRGPLIYRYNSPITLSLNSIEMWGSEDIDDCSGITISYKYSSTEDGEYQSCATPLNAGFYKVSFTLTSSNSNYKYQNFSESSAWEIVETSSNEFAFTRTFEIERRRISVSGIYGGTWGTYYIPYSYVGGNKTFEISSMLSTLYLFTTGGATTFSSLYNVDLSADELADMDIQANIITKNTGDQIVENVSAIGDYTTTITYSLGNSNYIFIGEVDDEEWEYSNNPFYYMSYSNFSRETIVESQEWSVISKTVDASGVTWDKTSFTYTYSTDLYPKLQNIPKGVDTSKKFVYVNSSSYIVESTSAPGFGNSNYRIRERIYLDNSVLGYDSDVQLIYPTGYDADNDYLEQYYTISKREFDFTAINFGVVVSTDSSWDNGIYYATLSPTGEANITIPYFANGYQNIRIVVVENEGIVTESSHYFYDEFDVSSNIPQSGDIVGTNGVVSGYIKPWSGAAFASGAVEIAFTVNWTIGTKTIEAKNTDYVLYQYVDGSNDYYIASLGNYEHPEQNESTYSAVLYSSLETQHLYVGSHLSNYVDIQYMIDKQIVADIEVSGGLTEQTNISVDIIITPKQYCQFDNEVENIIIHLSLEIYV